jgi:hypothetical protein
MGFTSNLYLLLTWKTKEVKYFKQRQEKNLENIFVTKVLITFTRVKIAH